MSTDSMERGFPRVTWEEVATHLIRRLAMDREWTHLGESEFTWWPSPLKTVVRVAASRDLEDGENPDNLLQLVAETYVVDCADEELGIQLANLANSRHILGAYIWEGGVVKVRNVLALNPLCRPLLSLFHEQILAGATDAWANSLEWGQSPLTPAHLEPHPESGYRKDTDELLGVFSGQYSLPQDEELPERFLQARNIIAEQMKGMGWVVGHTTEEVQYFQSDYVFFGIGIKHRSEINKYGWGITLTGGIMNMWMDFPDDVVHGLNRDLSFPDIASQFGPIVSGGLYDDGHCRLETFLPYGFLQEYGKDPWMLATNVGNAAVHFISGLSFFTISALGADQHSEQS